jgi:hypothetical protein
MPPIACRHGGLSELKGLGDLARVTPYEPRCNSCAMECTPVRTYRNSQPFPMKAHTKTAQALL